MLVSRVRNCSSDSDPGILCFQHCDKKVKVFCFALPKTCQLCGADLYTSELRIPPFRIPYPFTKAVLQPCAVAIRPTLGDFLHHYQNSTDLHIGVTDSQGIVYEYDKNGLKNNDTTRWSQCLAIQIVQQPDSKWREYWDYTLEIVSQQDRWISERYKEDDHNCYTFVLAFLRTLQLKSINKAVLNKMDFCREYILPRTISAGKYISLYRKLLTEKTIMKT